MALVSWEPKETRSLRNLFDDFFNFEIIPQSRSFKRKWLEGGEWSPLVDVIDEKNNLIVKAELPGMDKKDIKISLGENTLIIRGERKEEKEAKKEDYYCCERVYGTYSRTITLPVRIDKSKVKASYNNGVLEITLPKTEEVKPKEIEIETE
jgi:HSP20 family protein